MKRFLPLVMLIACLAVGKSLYAQAPASTSSEIYDFSGFDDEKLLKLFYDVQQQGRVYPTPEEFATVGIQRSDIETMRSHVRPRALLDRSDRIVQKTYEKRQLWMNIPMHSGKGGGVGYPSSDWNSDVYSMWNYTNLFGSWNHSWFQAPGCWVDAAHKNGSDILSGLKFFDTTGGRGQGAGSYLSFITEKNSDGSFKYVKPMIHLLMYFGYDGINYNFEASGYDNSDLVAFHKALYKYAAEVGFTNYHMGMYTSVNSLTSSNVNALFGTKTTGRTADLMLNYSGGDFSYYLASSAAQAISSMGTTDGLYAGVWIVNMDREWNRLDTKYDYSSRTYVLDENAHKCGICLWGEHADSRFWSYNTGSDTYNRQSNYQRLLERAFSGGNRNPLNRPAVSNTGNEWEGENALTTFAGLAEWIPERSVIQGDLPFATYFNLGNGDRYFYKGKRTAGPWYNMANQDVVPTYRWLVVNSGTETVNTGLQPQFTHLDAYMGGSCLQLKGTASSSGTDIVLYKTKLNVSSANPVASIAVKSGKEGVNPTNLYLIVKIGNDWKEYAVGNTDGASWQEKKLSLNLPVGTVIDRIGLRVKGSGDYEMLVGKLELNDDVKTTPSKVKDLNVEVREETKTSLSVKLYWDVDAQANARKDVNLVYNDEANIDHFEILYKNGEDGRVSEVGRTTQWTTYIGNIELGTDDKPYIGVRSVSTDLKTYSPVEWVQVPRGDISELPEAKKEGYGKSELDPNSAGVEIARQVRYLSEVRTTGATTDISYIASGPVADGTNYQLIPDQKLVVQQGQTFKLYFRAYGGHTDGLKWCVWKGWMDLDGDHVFAPGNVANTPGNTGEAILEGGTVRQGTEQLENAGFTYEITVPDDARVGESRVRIVFADAWFGGTLMPTGLTSKGFTLDFDVEIQGNNANQRKPVDNRDQGVADEPEGLNTQQGISDVPSQSEVSTVVVNNGAISFANVEKAWVYGVDGTMVKYIQYPKNSDSFSLAPNVYIVKMQNKNIIRSKKIAVK